MQLHHKRVGKDCFQGVVDKVKERLSSWKTTSFSLAGRSTLVSAVSSAIPNYTMQTAHFPSNVCDALDKQNRSFLWGSTEEHRRTHLVAWEEVCKEKKHGGLGMRNARCQNNALLMKLGWGLVKKRDALWVRIIRDKYKCGEDLIPHINSTSSGSNVWTGIKRTWDKVCDGIIIDQDRNTVRWKWERSGDFSIKSAYQVVTGNIEEQGRDWGGFVEGTRTTTLQDTTLASSPSESAYECLPHETRSHG